LTTRRVPLWLMGLTNLTYGLYGGAVAFAIPQVLSNRNVPEPAIAGLTAVAFSPGFWAFFFSPMLDVRYSRRWYAVVLAAIACLTLVLAMMNLNHMVVLEALLTIGFFCAYLYQSAVGGWLSTITNAEEESTLSVWMSIGNVGGFSVMAMCCSQLVVHLAPLGVALALGALILFPTAAFPFMPAPPPDRRLARESFSQFLGDVVSLTKRREVLVAVLLFVVPAATFSLTNFLGGLGNVFHATPGFVGVVAGAGVAAGGLTGCLLFPWIRRAMPLRALYLTIGAVGSLITFAFILLPHTPASFATILIGENFLQSLAVTSCTAIIFETIGRDNPLASTTCCFLFSAYGVPISYMLYVDAFGYRRGGAGGSLAADAAASLIACCLLACLLIVLARKRWLKDISSTASTKLTAN
jgi:PAT family beta-lactamase induction signal transducer AmpG